MKKRSYKMSNIEVRENTIKALLANKTKMLQSIIGDKKKSDNFTATALQIALSPDLKDCTEESIINCLVGAAMLDLNPDKNIGQAYIYRYGSVATLDVGYKGYQTIYSRAGYEIRTFPVFECDEFGVSFDGWEMKYNLIPNLEDRDLGNFEWEYANLKGILVVSKDMVTNEFKRDFIPQKVLEKMRKSSPNQKSEKPTHIWEKWYIDMCSKSAIKKFKNQLAIRSHEQQIAMIDMLDNHKNIDFEATKNNGIIIEAKISEDTPKEKPKSLNDLAKVDYSVEVLNKMIKNNVSEAKAKEYLSNKSDEEIKQLFDDEDLFQNECMDLIL
ncbi:recombinase RecT [Aliarcobacter butzleri]